MGSMFTSITVLVPTRGRPGRLWRLLESFDQTRVEDSTSLLFRVDEDDEASRALLKEREVVVGPRLGYANLPTMFNELYAASSSDLIMCGNDDMVFETYGWDHHILEAANKYPDGLFDFGMATHNEANFPFVTVSRKTCDRLGFLFDLRMFWGDIFWRDVMSHFGRAIMLPHVHIEHDWAGFNPDQVFIDGENTRRASHAEFHAVAVSEAINKLRMAA